MTAKCDDVVPWPNVVYDRGVGVLILLGVSVVAYWIWRMMRDFSD